MKSLVLIRHAAAASPGGTPDFDRPLSDEGRAQARAMGARLDGDARPDVLIASAARRAVETAQILATGAEIEPSMIETERGLYDATVPDVLKLLHAVPDRHERVALCGHNPVTAEMIRYLTLDFRGHVPTCAIARLDLTVDRWAHVDTGCARLASLEVPSI